MAQTKMSIEEFKALTGGNSARPERSARAGKPKRKSKADHAARFAATPPRPAMEPGETARQRALFDRHDAVTVSLRLPLPPSANQHWRIFALNGQQPRMILSAEGRAYREAVAGAWLSHCNGWTREPLTGRLRILVMVCYRDRRAIDIDNRCKPLLDAMADANIFGNDSQIDDLRVLRGHVCPPTGYVDCTIEVIPE